MLKKNFFKQSLLITSFLSIFFSANQVLAAENNSDEADYGNQPIVDTHDPYETFNRHVYKFNDTLDKVILKPVATVYKAILPTPIRKGVGNFFSNIGQIPTVANDLLQGRFYQATADTWRFAINSTVGIGGTIDVAQHIGLPSHDEDFGLTLAKWGYTSSNFLELPIFGPSTVRDTIGMPIDYEVLSIYPYITPNVISIRQRNQLLILDAVSQRAQLLDYDDVMQRAALDPYVFQRNAYLQRRQYLMEENNKPTSLEAQEDSPAPASPSYRKP